MLEYYKERILDELKDAVAYMRKAVEHKKDKCGWMFYNLAKDELKHANYLYRSFQETEKPETVTDSEYSAMMKAIMDAYSEHMLIFENLQKLYKEV